PYLSIYLQDVLGYSPLGAGVRFLPLTAFVFAVPLMTRRFAPGLSLRLLLSVGLALVAVALLLMHGLTTGSHWTALLVGLIVAGIGIGLANPAIAAALAFVSGLNAVLIVGCVVVAVGAVAAAALMRTPAPAAATAATNSGS